MPRRESWLETVILKLWFWKYQRSLKAFLKLRERDVFKNWKRIKWAAEATLIFSEIVCRMNCWEMCWAERKAVFPYVFLSGVTVPWCTLLEAIFYNLKMDVALPWMPSSVHNVWKIILKQWILQISFVSCLWKRQCYVLFIANSEKTIVDLNFHCYDERWFSIFQETELYCFNGWGFAWFSLKILSQSWVS